MTEHPLLLSTPMVRAFLAGRKTVTRRIPGPTNSLVDGRRVSAKKWKEFMFDFPSYKIKDGCFYFFAQSDYEWHKLEPIYKSGDILWFRETYFNDADHGEKPVYVYKADSENFPRGSCSCKPSIHMPKAACRLYAEVTTCTCEHLQDIAEEQAKAEGILWYHDEKWGNRFKDYIKDASGYGHPEHDYPTVDSAIASFGTLWRSINGPHSWRGNPPVYAINYKVLSTTGRPV